MNHGNILVVDDEPGVRDVLRDILENEGFTVVTVGNTQDALLEIEQSDFDVAIIDILLPPDTGLMLLRKLHEQKPHIVPIVITGYSSAGLANLASQEQAFDYISKPIDQSRLFAAVARALQAKKSPTQEETTSLRLGKMRALARCEPFDKLGDHELRDLVGVFKTKHCESGETVYQQNTHAPEIYVVQEGSVALTHQANKGTEKPITEELLGAGKMFGWAALFKPQIHLETAICQSATTVLAANGFELRFALAKEPKANLAVMETICTILVNKLRASYYLLESRPRPHEEKQQGS